MSIQTTSAVWEIDLPTREKTVLLAYADHADPDGASVYPSMGTIARKTGFSPRWCQVLTRRLEKKGYLVADGAGPRGTRRWRISPKPREAPQGTGGTAPDLTGPEGSRRGMRSRRKPAERGRQGNPVAGSGEFRGELSSGARAPSSRGEADPRAKIHSSGGEVRSGVKRTDPRGEHTSGAKQPAFTSEPRFARGARPTSPEPSLIVKEPPPPSSGEVPAVPAQSAGSATAREEASGYRNRDRIPAQLLPLADRYHEITGQTPSNSELGGWIAALKEWHSEGVTAAHVQLGYTRASHPGRIVRPSSLTGFARAAKGKESVSRRRQADSGDDEAANQRFRERWERSRRIVAQTYASWNLPFEDPDTMRPRPGDYPNFTYGTLKPGQPRVLPPEAIGKKIMGLAADKSVGRNPSGVRSTGSKTPPQPGP